MIKILKIWYIIPSTITGTCNIHNSLSYQYYIFIFLSYEKIRSFYTWLAVIIMEYMRVFTLLVDTCILQYKI